MNSGTIALIVFLSLLAGAAIVGVVVFFYVQYKATSRLAQALEETNAMVKPLLSQDMLQVFPVLRALVAQIPQLTQALTVTSSGFSALSKAVFSDRVVNTVNETERPREVQNEFMAPPAEETQLTPEQLHQFLKSQGQVVEEEEAPAPGSMYGTEA